MLITIRSNTTAIFNIHFIEQSVIETRVLSNMPKLLILCWFLLVVFQKTVVESRLTFQNAAVNVWSYASRNYTIINVSSNTLNIKSLRGYYKIVIENQNIPVLQTLSVSNLNTVKSIVFQSDGITQIRKNAFHNLKSLKQLRISGNNITALGPKIFSCEKLQHLDLSDNSIETIDKNAFANARSLRAINFDHNKLKTIDPEWLQYTQDVYEISLKYNLISELHKGMFAHLKGTRTYNNSMIKDLNPSIYLDYNQIEKVEDGSFSGPQNIYDLFLSHNKISNLSRSFFEGVDSVHWLDLTKNRITCIEAFEIFEAVNITMLDENPWDCNCILNVTEMARKNRKTVLANISLVKCLQVPLTQDVKGN